MTTPIETHLSLAGRRIRRADAALRECRYYSAGTYYGLAAIAYARAARAARHAGDHGHAERAEHRQRECERASVRYSDPAFQQED